MKNTLKTKDLILKLIDFLDETVCRKFLFDLFRAPVCQCGKSVPDRHLKRFYDGKQIYCKNCDSKFFPRAGTVLQQTKLTCRQILKMTIMISQGYRTKEITAAVNVGSHTVPRWRKKLSEVENE